MYQNFKKIKANNFIVGAISFLFVSLCFLAVNANYKVNIKSWLGEFNFEPAKTSERKSQAIPPDNPELTRR